MGDKSKPEEFSMYSPPRDRPVPDSPEIQDDPDGKEPQPEEAAAASAPAVSERLDALTQLVEKMEQMLKGTIEELNVTKNKNELLEEKIKGQEDNKTKGDKLMPIHHKNIDKPEKYDGNTDHWLRWMKTFKKFLKRQDGRWVDLLDEIEKQEGKPITKDVEKSIAVKLNIVTDIAEFRSQLNEYLETFTKGTVKQLVEACGDSRSLDAWRQPADKGHSLRKFHKRNLRKKAYDPKPAPNVKEVEKHIAA